MLTEAGNTLVEDWAQVSGMWQSRVYMAALLFSWVNLSLSLHIPKWEITTPRTFLLGKTQWTQSSSWQSALLHSPPKVRIANVNRHLLCPSDDLQMKGQFTRPPASPDKAISRHFLLSTETQKTVHAKKKILNITSIFRTKCNSFLESFRKETVY